MTNNDLLSECFRMTGILAEGIPLSAEMAQNGLTIMNDMLSEWSADHIDVGFIPQVSISADVQIYDNALRAVKFNLAVELAQSYGHPIPPDVQFKASKTFDRLVRDTVNAAQQEADMRHLPGVVGIWDIETG
jgi:hypothetical protein